MEPLADVRIVSVEQYGAGPFGTLHLADLGAEVIKIEDPATGGDVGRYVPPFTDGEDSLFFEALNRNKKSLSLDLRSDAGRRVFEDLVAVSDAVYSNLRGDVPAQLGLRYDDLKHRNPRVVCCSLSGFGMTGPRSSQPGYDYVLQGMAGWMSLTGEPDGPPTKSGLSLVDWTAGIVAASSLLVGLHAAARDGVGGDCDVSLFDTALSLLTYPGAWTLTGGYEATRTRHSAHPSLVPFQVFETADGWAVVGCAKEKFWHRLVGVLGREELGDDPRFATFADRFEHADELLEILEAEFRRRPTAAWLDDLAAAGVPSGPVNSVAEAAAEPQTEARGMIVATTHPRWGTVRQMASPIRFGDGRRSHRRAPYRNEHAEEVLEHLLGYDDRRVDALRSAGAFGQGSDTMGPPPPEERG